MHLEVYAASRKNLVADKPNEDAYRYDAERGIFCIADGITRSRDRAGNYPQPSGAVIASHYLVDEAMQYLLQQDFSQPDQIELQLRGAFARANDRIAVYAASQPEPNFIDRDYPGTVGTILVIHDRQAYWAHLGDTVLLQLKIDGSACILTSDQVRKVDAWLYEHGKRWPPAERFLYARRDLRNNPAAPAGFGALTGQPEALHFIETGHTAITPGDAFALLSDGLDNLWSEAGRNYRDENRVPANIERLLRARAIDTLIDETEAADAAIGSRSDDKTVILIECIAQGNETANINANK